METHQQILKHYKEVISKEKGQQSITFFKKLLYAAVPASLLFASIIAFLGITISYIFNSGLIKKQEAKWVSTNGSFATPGSIGRYKFNYDGTLQLPDATKIPNNSIIAANNQPFVYGANYWDNAYNCPNGLCNKSGGNSIYHLSYSWVSKFNSTVEIQSKRISTGIYERIPLPIGGILYPCRNGFSTCFNKFDFYHPLDSYRYIRMEAESKNASFITQNSKWYPLLLPRGFT